VGGPELPVVVGGSVGGASCVGGCDKVGNEGVVDAGVVAEMLCSCGTVAGWGGVEVAGVADGAAGGKLKLGGFVMFVTGANGVLGVVDGSDGPEVSWAAFG
jgi:hypothetical protein